MSSAEHNLAGLSDKTLLLQSSKGKGSAEQPWWSGFACLAKNDSIDAPQDPDTPYEFKGVHMEIPSANKPKPARAYCCKPFPFVGPHRPPQTLGRKSWDKWIDSFAYCAGTKIIVGKCEGDTAQTLWRPLFTFNLADVPNGAGEVLYTLDWTIDPFTLQPLIIAGGDRRLVYVLDCGSRTLRRVFKGHGGSILALSAHPTQFHIIASASEDQSIRIWNIFGAEAETPRRGQMRSDNYAQARAEEGTVIVAVLGGRPSGGHMDEIQALAWHPRHRAIASGGRDHQFKIWPVPPLPACSANGPSRAPRSYRPAIVVTPIFATDDIVSGPISDVAWISNDMTLVSGSNNGLLIQWLGYSRYFDKRREAPLLKVIDDIPMPDFDNSGSYTVVRKFRCPTDLNMLKIGLHRRFTPLPHERSDPNIVTDHLLAMPARSKRNAELKLFALGITPPNKPPKLDLGTEVEHDPALSPRRREYMWRLRRKGHKIEEHGNGNEVIVIRDDTPSPDDSASKDGPIEGISESVNHTHINETDDSDTSNTDYDSDETEVSPDYAGPAYRWTLKFDARVPTRMGADNNKTRDVVEEDLEDMVTWVQACAISPRGAKWIVGVGQYESIWIWRRRDV